MPGFGGYSSHSGTQDATCLCLIKISNLCWLMFNIPTYEPTAEVGCMQTLCFSLYDLAFFFYANESECIAPL